MSKVYLIVVGNSQNEEKIGKYKEVAGPIMKKYGGVMPPESYKVTSVLAGNLNPQFLLKVEFPNKEKIEEAFNDSDYKSVVGYRDEGFGDLSILIIEG